MHSCTSLKLFGPVPRLLAAPAVPILIYATGCNLLSSGPAACSRCGRAAHPALLGARSCGCGAGRSCCRRWRRLWRRGALRELAYVWVSGAAAVGAAGGAAAAATGRGGGPAGSRGQTGSRRKPRPKGAGQTVWGRGELARRWRRRLCARCPCCECGCRVVRRSCVQVAVHVTVCVVYRTVGASCSSVSAAGTHPLNCRRYGGRPGAAEAEPDSSQGKACACLWTEG